MRGRDSKWPGTSRGDVWLHQSPDATRKVEFSFKEYPDVYLVLVDENGRTGEVIALSLHEAVEISLSFIENGYDWFVQNDNVWVKPTGSFEATLKQMKNNRG